MDSRDQESKHLAPAEANDDFDASDFGEYLGPEAFGEDFHQQLLLRYAGQKHMTPDEFEAVAIVKEGDAKPVALPLESIKSIEDAGSYFEDDESGVPVEKKGVFSRVHLDKRHAAEAVGVFSTLALATAVIMIRKKRKG
jgi:hypothetical protein